MNKVGTGRDGRREAPSPKAHRVHLRLLATSDLHLNLHGYDYFADRPAPEIGLGRLTPHIAQLRAEAPNSLLLDNGDLLQGNPMGDFIAHERGLAAGDVHPAFKALNALGYDAAALGNHDFNYGLDFLVSAVAGADFPVLCANVATALASEPENDTTLTRPFALIDREFTDDAGRTHPIRIGILGFVTPQITLWDRHHLRGRVATRDIVSAARAWVPVIRAAGADIVIALCHSGIGVPVAHQGMENAATALGAVAGLDAIVAGHSHMVFPDPAFDGWPGVDIRAGTLHGTPAVMPGFWGSHLGVMDLALEVDGGDWRVVGHNVEARGVSGAAGRDRAGGPQGGGHDAIVPEVTAKDHAETLAYIRRPVGRTDTALHTYFAFVGEDSALRAINQAQRWYVRRMLGASHADWPVLSAAAPFKSGGRGGPGHYTEVPAGELRMSSVADLYHFPNRLQAVRINGVQLRDWLERAAALFRQVTPGASDAPLLEPDFPGYDFDVIGGDLRYLIDPTRRPRFDVEGRLIDPKAGRIRDLRHAGRPVADDQQFIIATNTFRLAGGGHFPALPPDALVLDAPDTNRDVIMRHVQHVGTLRLEEGGGWRLALPPGTSVVFDTGPGAARHVSRLPIPAPERLGVTEQGFVRYRIAG